jgi:plastocyanin
MRPGRRQTVTFIAAIAASALLGFPAVADTNIVIDQFRFSPERVTVKTGTTVTWTNDDDIPHTVASSTQLFKSKALDTADKFSFTFRTPGVYGYFCSIHPHMTGTVVVEATAGTRSVQ